MRTDMRGEIEVRPLDGSDIELCAPLWKALLDHVAELPGGAGVPVRPFEQSWPIERRHMLQALTHERGFVLVARRGEAVIGYAFVTVEDASSVWYTGDLYGELAHLIVAADERGKGVGTAVLDAVDAELERRGIDDVQLGVDRGNDDARRFYERRGYRYDFLIFYGSPGNRPWACRTRDDADRLAGRGRYALPSGRTPAPQAPPAHRPRGSA